mmetsp:Transcript_42550/g.89319  ORF Transcript_42550/g.89319 Transcript_42550/m.89319 type:complete len:166 (+) Transcript_42550:814-1311(+)
MLMPPMPMRQHLETTPCVFYVYIPPQLCSTLQQSFLNPNTTNNNSRRSNPKPLRILLALHGYTGRPLQEIRKWHSVVTSLNAILLAPAGTLTPSMGLGWNAIDCCGDPVLKGVNDLDFVVNGVVETFLNVLGKQPLGGQQQGGDNSRRGNVIATGFSNGGFLSSL